MSQEREKIAPWITINLDSEMLCYVLELVSADTARVRALFQHARSRGERTLTFRELTLGSELSEVLMLAHAKALATVVRDDWLEGLFNDRDRGLVEKVAECLVAPRAREAFIDGLMSAATLLEPEGQVIGPGARGEPAPADKPDRGEPFERPPQPHEE